MLDDAMLIERAADIIRTEHLNAGSALERALAEISTLFDQAEDAYLRERQGDVGDVVGRLCMNLRADGDPLDMYNDLEGPLVLVADELTPSAIAQLDWQRFAAFVTDAGSWTYHTAILARSIHVRQSRASVTPRPSSRRAPGSPWTAPPAMSSSIPIPPNWITSAAVSSDARPMSSRWTSTAGCRQ